MDMYRLKPGAGKQSRHSKKKRPSTTERPRRATKPAPAGFNVYKPDQSAFFHFNFDYN